MTEMTFKEKLEDNSNFVINVELTAGFGYKLNPIKKFLEGYREEGDDWVPEDFNFCSITFPQNPGGVANLDPADVLRYVDKNGLLDGLHFVPHISCKDHNEDGLKSLIIGYQKAGIDNILVLTGDKPISSKGVFELDAIGLLRMIRQMNNKALTKAKPDSLDSVHRFYTGAAVSPFKYTEPSLLQQYFKMEKKIKTGAEFLITQVGWDWKKSKELFQYMQDNEIDVPVIGNVYMLSNSNKAAKLMHDIELPGCFVSDDLLEKVYSESKEENIERAAQQVAMYKTMGAAGADIGGVHNFKTFQKIVKRAAEIGQDWEKYKDNLYWPAEESYYLYDENGKQNQLSKHRKKLNHAMFKLMHRSILDPDYKGFHAFNKVMKTLGAEKGEGFAYKSFFCFEKVSKYLLFDCEECGDCFLPENFSWCTIGGCEKGMDNAPCGDATVEGMCGNNLDRICIGEYIYKAAASEKNGLETLRKRINQPRNPELENTSSMLNYIFGKDHTMKNPIIYIGESVHASIPKTGKIMKELQQMGPDAYKKPSDQLDYIKALIQSQADDGADYIAVNLDSFGEEDPQLAVDMMKEYVKMVRKWGEGVPICIDSSNNEVLIAGLKEWYNTDEEVKQPLINSIKDHNIDELMPLKKHYDYSFIGLLVTESQGSGPKGMHTIDDLYEVAKTIFDAAVNKYGFKPEEIFFDTTVFPLAIDMPMEPGTPSFTYRAFETIKKIKNDPDMKDVHFSLGISNCCRDLPARKIGICRAYVKKAREYGLDAGIVNTSHKYGYKEADPELVKLVDAFAKNDGSPEKMNEPMMLMGKFCSENKK